jgi:hypothetical protein
VVGKVTNEIVDVEVVVGAGISETKNKYIPLFNLFIQGVCDQRYQNDTGGRGG